MSQLDAFEARLARDESSGGLKPLEQYLNEFSGNTETMARMFLAAKRLGGPVAPTAATAGSEGEDFIGSYRLIRELGRGGQGVVYLAEDTRLHRQIALKVLTHASLVSEATLVRFRREAEVASRLEHPGICSVHDAGTAGGISYIAMQYVEGQTLAEMVSKAMATDEAGSLPTTMLNFLDESEDSASGSGTGDEDDDLPDSATRRQTTAESVPRDEVMRILKIFEGAGRALHVAHEAGITHRDIKPGNIMVTLDERPVILDFGLARMEEDDGPSITQSGDLFGTPQYMSPEQLMSNRIVLDCRTDVWSLGVSLYKCLTLADAFTAPTRQTLYQAILTRDPTDPRHLNPTIPPDLKIVLETAMEKDRDRRYKTAEEFADELRRVQEFEPIKARPPGVALRIRRWSQRNPALAVAVAALFLMLVGGLGFFMNQAASERELRRVHKLEVAPLEVERLLTRARDELWPPVPAMIPAIRSWLADIQVVKEDIPAHQEKLRELRAKGVLKDGVLMFEDVQDRWSFEAEEKLLKTMESFGGESLWGPTIAAMNERLAHAESITGETIEKHAKEWQVAVSEVAVHPAFKKLDLAPQVGLIPLGKDAESGLQEFAHLPSGQPAVRDPKTGKLAITEATGIVLVLVPGDTFMMGRQSSDSREPNYEQVPQSPKLDRRDGPPHEVNLRPYFISKYEMTQAQWLHITGEQPSQCKPNNKSLSRGFTLLNPVEMVSWGQCRHTLFRVGLKLPTEAQWEFACRAGTTTPYSTGERLNSLVGFANFNDQQFDLVDHRDGYEEPAPVGSYKPNDFGLHDMHGNVWEWCQDRYVEYPEHPARDGDGLRDPLVGMGRTTRGGSCLMDYKVYGRTTARQAIPVSTTDWVQGVRPCRPIDE